MMHEQQVRPRRRLAGLALVAAAVAGATVVGGGLGALAGTSTSRPEGPSRPPDLPAEFPGAGGRYLPGVTVSSLQDWLAQDGYECRTDDPELPPDSGAHRVDCYEPADADAAVHVVVEYDEPDQVRTAYTSCQRGPRSPEDACRRFFSGFTAAAFTGQPDLQEEAGTWAAENAENDAATVLGGIELRIALQDSLLHLLPAG